MIYLSGNRSEYGSGHIALSLLRITAKDKEEEEERDVVWSRESRVRWRASNIDLPMSSFLRTRPKGEKSYIVLLSQPG